MNKFVSVYTAKKIKLNGNGAVHLTEVEEHQKEPSPPKEQSETKAIEKPEREEVESKDEVLVDAKKILKSKKPNVEAWDADGDDDTIKKVNLEI